MCLDLGLVNPIQPIKQKLAFKQPKGRKKLGVLVHTHVQISRGTIPSREKK
jgi:hypothetical protein